MENGFNGIPLAVFTGTAPSGTTAIVLIAALLLAHGAVSPEKRALVKQLMAIPLAVTWFGFIASATHLGTPANALYAFSNVGSSPLSNEVTAAVAFLCIAGVYWLLSFQPNCHAVVDTIGLPACVASGVVLLGFTSFAYNAPTVPTWSVWFAPASMILAGAAGGLSVMVLVASLASAVSKRAKYVMLGCSVVLVIACAVMLLGYNDFLRTVGNNVADPGSVSGAYAPAIPIYAALALAGLGLQAATVRTPMTGKRVAVLCSAGCLLVLAASVIVRVPFYEVFLSAGF